MTLSDEHHISRHCRYRDLYSSGYPTHAAFYYSSNDKNKECISVNWNEYFTLDLETSIPYIRSVFRNKLRTNSRDTIAILNVGRTKARILAAEGTLLKIERAPVPNDDSHVCIRIDSPVKEYIAGQLAMQVDSIYKMESDT